MLLTRLDPSKLLAVLSVVCKLFYVQSLTRLHSLLCFKTFLTSSTLTTVCCTCPGYKRSTNYTPAPYYYCLVLSLSHQGNRLELHFMAQEVETRFAKTTPDLVLIRRTARQRWYKQTSQRRRLSLRLTDN